MSNNLIIQDDKEIREKVADIQQDQWDERAKTFLKYLFRNRPYFRKWWLVMLVLYICTLSENILSGFGAYNFLLRWVDGWLDTEYLTYIVIGMILLIELLKQAIGLPFFKKAFSTKIDFFQMTGLILITIFSMYTTKMGTESAVHNYTDAPTLVNTDSISNFYLDKILLKEDDIAFYKAKADEEVSNWKILNETIPTLNEEKSMLEAQQNDELTAAQIKNDSILLSFNSKTHYTATTVGNGVWLYNLIALLLQSVLGFMLYKSALNYEVISPENSTETEVESPANSDTDTSVDIPVIGSRKIGFQMKTPTETKPENDHLNSTESFEFQDFTTEFSEIDKTEIAERLQAVPVTKLVQQCRNAFRRMTTSKSELKRTEKEIEFKETYTYLTSLGFNIEKISETGLKIKDPE